MKQVLNDAMMTRKVNQMSIPKELKTKNRALLFRRFLCLFLAATMAQSIPMQITFAQTDDLDRLFDDEDDLTEPPGTFNVPPPPPVGGKSTTPDLGGPAGFPDEGGSQGKFPTPQNGKGIRHAKAPTQTKKTESKKPDSKKTNNG